jgi:hypothetical protein
MGIKSSQWNWHIVEFIVIKSIAIVGDVEEFFVNSRPITRRLAKKIPTLKEDSMYVSYPLDFHIQMSYQHQE